MLRVSGSLQKSGEVMKLVNETIKLPEMQKTMFEMSKGEACGCVWSPAGFSTVICLVGCSPVQRLTLPTALLPGWLAG
jgi:hypothetical protein